MYYKTNLLIRLLAEQVCKFMFPKPKILEENLGRKESVSLSVIKTRHSYHFPSYFLQEFLTCFIREY